MLQNLVDYKAKSFLSERNSSSIAYEVKAVRAMWDPSLSIPGTNRRGGWRCPVGTRYGGQITDRFGRSCGWGAARRIANMISDVGSRLERADDGKRGRRIARREQRMIRRLAGTGNGAGRIERGLRGVAERLDGGDSSTNVPSLNAPSVDRRVPSIRTPEAPRELTPARPAPGARVRRPNPNLRDSEARRMEREINEPGAPRTGEAPARPRRPARARRPRGENNLRESEQRRMDREIAEPGAPRTDESAVRPAPQPRQVDPKLSKEEASDANASEDFAPYVNRKYDEYARNVRLLNENNKPAGMMTRRQWYAVNEDNLREAWGNAHGREAPRDFIPPTPRRRQRANRRRDAVADTAKAPKARKVPKVLAQDFEQLDRDIEEARDMLHMMQQNNASPARIRQQRAKIRRIEGQIRDLGDRARQENGANRERNLLANEPDDVIRDMINEMVRDPDFDGENPEYIRALAEWNRRQNLPDRNAGRAKPRRDPPGQSDNAAVSEELRQARSQAARQAAEVLANADRERAFAMDDPEEFANAFMPSIWNQIPPVDRQEFRQQYRDEQGAIDDVLQDLEQRILDDEFGDPDDLRERIIINNQEIVEVNKRLERDLQALEDLVKPAQRAMEQNRRDALKRIAFNARDRRRRELENDKFQEAIDIADANGSTPKSKKPKNSANEIEPKALAEVFDENGIDVFDVLGFDRLEVMNNADNFPHIDNGRFLRRDERSAARNARIANVRQDANRRVDGAIAVRKRLQDDLMQGNIDKENYVMFGRGGESLQRVGLVEIFRRLDEFQEAWEGIIGDMALVNLGPVAKPKARKVDLNQILDERFFGQYIREDVIPNQRLMIVNDPANFPNGAAERKTKRAEAIQKANRAISALDKIDKAIARGDLSDNDFIERNGEKINVARVKQYLKNYKDAWREVYNDNVTLGIVDAPEAPAPKAQIARLRADVAEAERNLDQMERNGARDVVMRKERARIDQLMIQIASLRDKRPRDSDGVLLTDQTPEPKAPAVPNAQDAPGFDYIGRDRLERLFGAEAANAYELKLNKEIGRIGGDNLEEYTEFAKQATPEFLRQLRQGHAEEIFDLKDKLRDELNDFSEVRSKPFVDDAYRKERLRRVTNINAQLEKAKRKKKMIDDEINVREVRARANRNTTGSKTPAAPKAPVAPKAPAINPTEAPVQVNNVPITLRPAVRPSHKGVLENDQKEIAGQQVLARRGTDAANFALLVDDITLKKRAEIAKANTNRNKVLTSLFQDIDAGVDINAIIPGGNKSRLQGVLDAIDALSTDEKRQFNEANLKQKLDEMRNLINVNWEELQKLPADASNAPQYKTRLGNIAKLEADIVRIENHFWLKKNVEEELRKAKARKDSGLNRVPDEAVGTVVVDDNIKNQFKDAISRRNNKLVQYLDQRHADGSPRPYEDMTTAKWDAMTEIQKKVYLTAAYSHKKIAGANGKFYQIRVESIRKNGSNFDIVTKIDEITEDGRVLRSTVGNSNRTVHGGQLKYVDMRYLKLDNPIDKGADIATIYNQHAFLYLSKMGAKYAEVHPAWDGPYVWARAGYRSGRKFSIGNLTAFEEGLKFYENFGPGGIISSDKEYRRVKKMLEKTRLNPRGVYEAQDWIFAIDDTPGDPVRRTYIKDWYLRNHITIGDAKLDFAREEIGKNLGKKAVKKAARPRAARPRARVVRPANTAEVPPVVTISAPNLGQTV